MRLSKASAHGALSLAFLANRSEAGPIQARQVADHLGIPTDSALKILQSLARSGLLQSQLGRAGGYRMLRDPSSVTLLEVVEVMDGPINAQLPFGPADTPDGADFLEAACQQAAVGLRAELARYTVAELARLQSEPVTADAG